MFAIVTGQDKTDRKLFSRKFKVTNVKQDDIAFFLVELKKTSYINKIRVKNLLGDTRLILSDDIFSLSDKQFNFVDDYVYSNKLFQNGLEYLLKESSPINKSKSVTLIDIQSKFQDIADILIKYFNVLRIVTNKTELYQNYVDTKLYDCGATVIIENTVKTMECTAMYVSPDGIIFEQMNNSIVPILSISNINNIDAPIIHSFRAKTPLKYVEIMPKGINEHLFQAAIYNYCGIRKLSSLYPSKVNVNFEKKDIKQIVLMTK